MKIQPFKPSVPNSKKVKNLKHFFMNAKEQFLSYDKDGLFKHEKDEQILIYEVLFNGKTHTGILCTIASKEIIDGNVVRHENTLKEKEKIMMELIKERNANVKPVLLTIPDDEKFSKWMGKHKGKRYLEFEYNSSEIHRLYSVSDDGIIKKLTKFFNNEVEKAYIADGHHRCFSIDKLYLDNPKKYGQLLVAIFPFKDLIIKPYNRIISFHEPMSLPAFELICSQYFKVSKASDFEQPAGRKTMMAYHNHEWITLKWKKEYLNSMEGGAMDLFNHYILNGPVKDIVEEIHYIQGDMSLSDTLKQTDKSINNIAFFFPSVTFKQLKPLLDNGGLVAPKSTYFEPRMRNGLVVQKL